MQKAGNVSKEYLNIFKTKLTNTVVDTVYMAENITKTVLPGNPVTRDYEVNRHIGSAGPGLLWKLYAGFKKSTKQEATVFVLNKKQLETYSKRNRDLIIEAFKKGATQLARIKHPRILSLQHQLEESKCVALLFAPSYIYLYCMYIYAYTYSGIAWRLPPSRAFAVWRTRSATRRTCRCRCRPSSPTSSSSRSKSNTVLCK